VQHHTTGNIHVKGHQVVSPRLCQCMIRKWHSPFGWRPPFQVVSVDGPPDSRSPQRLCVARYKLGGDRVTGPYFFVSESNNCGSSHLTGLTRLILHGLEGKMLRRSSFSASLQPAHKNSPHWLAEQMLCWANSGRRGKEKTCLSPSVLRKSRYNPSPCGTR
jgi:hypothetical protein